MFSTRQVIVLKMEVAQDLSHLGNLIKIVLKKDDATIM